MKFVLYLLFLLLMQVNCLMAACTGNSVGSCTSTTNANLTECAVTLAVVGTAMPADGNIEEGNRTSYAQYPLEFKHDGGEFDYNVTAVTAGQDSGSSMMQNQCEGRLTVFFNEPGKKDIKVRVFQNATGRSVVSQNSMAIIYDTNPPSLEIQRVFKGTNVSADEQGMFYSAGTTYYTSDEITIRARATDEELATLQEKDKLRIQVVEGLSLPGEFVTPLNDSDGSFEFPVGLDQETEGSYMLKISAVDGEDGLLEDQSPANFSEPLLLRVVKDETPPVMTSLEIIRHYGTANQVIKLAPKVFVGEGTIRVRASFSEDLQAPPSLSIEQLGLGGEVEPPPVYKATYDTTLFQLNPSVVEYIFAPRTSLNGVGPARFIFGEEGTDMAGNPVAVDMGFLSAGPEVEEAIIVDVVPPDLNRVDVSVPGSIRTSPTDGVILHKYGFPSEILAVVNDYNLPQDEEDPFSGDSIAMDYASGVDFSRIEVEGDSLQMEFIGPDDQPFEGTLVTQPPNGLLYLLPDKDELFPGQPGKPETAGIPPGGLYTVRVTLMDKVGNTIVRTFSFTIDVEDIRPDSIQVSLQPPPPDNPYLVNPIKGARIPDTREFIDISTIDSVRLLQSFSLCSTDPGFSLTGSVISLKARLHGPDTVARSLKITGTPNLSDTENTCGVVGSVTYQIDTDQTAVFPYLDFQFPNPANIGGQVSSGTKDPRFGKYDGPYIVEVDAKDSAGNISSPIKKEFLLDTTPPYTEDSFPKASGKINTPLRHVSAILVDPHPPQPHTFDGEGHVNFGSGISIDHSAMKLFLHTPYGTPSTEVFDESNNNRVKGSLNFIHFPNSSDPELPGYDPEDDAYRVLLEFRDKNGSTVTLPVDGTADGIYHMEILPVDNAGNTIDNAIEGASGYNVQNLTEENRPQELRKDFYFLLDTIPPTLSIGNVGDSEIPELNVAGVLFAISGKTRDLSARPGADALKGGAGIDRVEYDIVLMNGDGTLVAPVAGTENSPAKPNPLFAPRPAKLSAISDASKDPHTSSTKPLDPATYSELEQEERSWTINDTLPPYNEILTSNAVDANYWLRISSYDQAGNYNRRLVRMIMTYGMENAFGRLDPPELEKPSNNGHLKHVVVGFEWKGVRAATDYLLTLSHPHGVVTTHEVVPDDPGQETTVSTFQILNNEGQYTWWVEARDSVGNIGDESARYKFVMDRTAPKVGQMSWIDISPEAMGRLSRGQFVLNLQFSEELQTAPLVKFRVADNSVPEQIVVTRQFSDDFWEGLVTIPQSADVSWDGLAKLEISQAVDMAGNKMVLDQNRSFEIKTGPGFRVRFFRNPVRRDELLLVAKSTEDVMGLPAVFSPSGVTMMKDNMLQIDERTFSIPLKLKSTMQNQASIEITGRDLQGNPSTRVVTFAVQPLNENTATIRSENLVLTLPGGCFTAGTDFMALLPPPDMEDEPGDGGVAKSLGLVAIEQPELKKIGSFELLFSSSRPLKPVAGYWRSPVPVGAKQGLFLEADNGLIFLGLPSEERELYFALEEFGALAVYEDRVPPRIASDDLELALSGRKKTLSFVVSDDGVGLADNGLIVRIDGYNDASLNCMAQIDNKFVCDLPGGMSAGDYDLNVEASDRVGNVSLSRSVLTVPGPVRIQLDVFPNPARDFSMIQYDLSRAAEFIRLKIYDSSGRVVYVSDSDREMDLTLGRGRNSLRWDLNNSNGGRVASGVYFCELSVRDVDGNKDLKRVKLVVLR